MQKPSYPGHQDHFGRQAGLLFQGPTATQGTAVMLEFAGVLAKAGK
jgi:hypothetical protein